MAPFLSFLAVAAGAMLIPGPDTLVVLRTALVSGPVAGTWAAAGSGVGNLAWGGASVLGATTLLAASTAWFTALKLAGATYIAFLGIQALAAAVRGQGIVPVDAWSGRISRNAAFRRGLMSDLLNVKVGLFWTALVPQFLGHGASPLLPPAMVAAMGCLAFGWLTAYAWMAARLSARLATRRVSRALNGAIGVVLVGLGARLYVST
jgi:threonine/homoserine/homoserine lactone efflux protein